MAQINPRTGELEFGDTGPSFGDFGEFEDSFSNTPGDPFNTTFGGTSETGDGEGGGSGVGGRVNQFFKDLFTNPQTLFAFLGMATSYLQSRSQNESTAFTKEALERARALADPKRVEEITRQLTPLFKEAIAQGTGPQLQQAISANVARRGLTGTGIGLAAQNAAATIPGIESFRAALDQAGRSQTQQVNTELGIGSIGVPRTVGTLEALLLGGAAGARGGVFNNDPTQPRDERDSSAGSSLFPNLKA